MRAISKMRIGVSGALDKAYKTLEVPRFVSKTEKKFFHLLKTKGFERFAFELRPMNMTFKALDFNGDIQTVSLGVMPDKGYMKDPYMWLVSRDQGTQEIQRMILSKGYKPCKQSVHGLKEPENFLESKRTFWVRQYGDNDYTQQSFWDEVNSKFPVETA